MSYLALLLQAKCLVVLLYIKTYLKMSEKCVDNLSAARILASAAKAEGQGKGK